MKPSHREEKRGDRLLDILTDEETGLRIVVSRLGAELISLARRDSSGNWVGLLNRDNELDPPPQGWANHATVMGYYLHRLKDGRSLYRGREIRGGTHSFLRHKTWHLVDETAGASALTYRITQSDFLPEEYPLNVSLDLTYRIENDKVVVAFHFRNHEASLTAHVGFGLHPGFAAAAFETFQLQMPPGKYRRHFAPDNYLSGETKDIEFKGGEMPFPRQQLPGSFILELVDVPTRTFVYTDVASSRRVTIDLAGVPYLTLWSDGGPFLCVEPCWGLTDYHQQRAFEDKEGIQRIPSGGELRAEFSMKPERIAAH